MKYPALIINRQKLKENVERVVEMCRKAGIEPCAVVKCLCAIPEITQIYVEAGIKALADSRIDNLKKIPYAGIKKWLLRIPMLSEIKDVALYADVSLNSEIETVKALSEEAEKIGKKAGVVLMVDLGDLREGVLAEDAVETAVEISKLKGIEFLGVGTNLNCYGSIIPTTENLKVLTGIAKQIEEKLNKRLQIISGGNSGSIHLISNGIMPKEINNLRIGETILLGNETSYQKHIENLHTDVFRFDAQIIELKTKPSLPFGESGLNSFGEKVYYEDKGLMKRAIIACGRQDVDGDKISPVDESIQVIGYSSDHMIVDITNAKSEYHLGNTISFNVTYGGLLSLCTSEYVLKAVE